MLCMHICVNVCDFDVCVVISLFASNVKLVLQVALVMGYGWVGSPKEAS